MLIFSGHDKAMEDDKSPNHPKRSYHDIFLNPNFPNRSEVANNAGEDLQKVLDALADESGYREIRYAPRCPSAIPRPVVLCGICTNGLRRGFLR